MVLNFFGYEVDSWQSHSDIIVIKGFSISFITFSADSVMQDPNNSSLPLWCLVADEQNRHLAANTPVLLGLSTSGFEVYWRNCLTDDVDGAEISEGIVIAVKFL